MSEQVFLAASANVAPLRANNVIAVASGKGGVGKTWFSVTLTHALARLGRRALLFDGDLGLANVDIQLGLTPRNDLGKVFEGSIALDAAAERFDAGGFDIIAGRSGSGSFASLPSQRVTNLRNDLLQMAHRYDKVILDMAAGVDRMVRTLAGPAGVTLVITTDDPASITDAYAFIKVTRGANPAADLRIVVNMAGTLKEGERTYQTIAKACKQFLKFAPPLAGIVQRDNRVRDSLRAQMPILLRHPMAQAAQDVEAIARRLLGG